MLGSIKAFVVAIDGPSGAGKSTIGKAIAERFGFSYIDTGAIYRSVALHAVENNLSINDQQVMANVAASIDITFKMKLGQNKIYLDGRDVTEAIRKDSISMIASKISSYPGVRVALLDMQRNFGKSRAIVLDGRDIGTVVFPSADIKVFLTASSEERAKRRHRELLQKGAKITLQEVKESIEKRDSDDSTRKAAPLKKADDAIEVDSTSMSIEIVLDQIAQLIERKYNANTSQ